MNWLVLFAIIGVMTTLAGVLYVMNKIADRVVAFFKREDYWPKHRRLQDL